MWVSLLRRRHSAQFPAHLLSSLYVDEGQSLLGGRHDILKLHRIGGSIVPPRLVTFEPALLLVEAINISGGNLLTAHGSIQAVLESVLL